MKGKREGREKKEKKKNERVVDVEANSPPKKGHLGVFIAVQLCGGGGA